MAGANAGPVCATWRRGNLPRHQEAGPFGAIRGDRSRCVLESWLPRNRVPVTPRQAPCPPLRTGLVGPVDRHEQLPLPLVGSHCNPEDAGALCRFDTRKAAIDQAMPPRRIGMHLDERLTTMLRQLGRQASTGHRVPLVTITPGIEPQRKRATAIGARRVTHRHHLGLAIGCWISARCKRRGAAPLKRQHCAIVRILDRCPLRDVEQPGAVVLEARLRCELTKNARGIGVIEPGKPHAFRHSGHRPPIGPRFARRCHERPLP